jgi:hypothetical protein
MIFFELTIIFIKSLVIFIDIFFNITNIFILIDIFNLYIFIILYNNVNIFIIN